MFLFGCRHSRTTFPQTPNRGPRKDETYVACLSCGREFPYSWEEMRIVQPKVETSELRAEEAM